MASSCCWSCIAKLRPAPLSGALAKPQFPMQRIASFHTTAPNYAMPPKKSSNKGTQIKFRQKSSPQMPGGGSHRRLVRYPISEWRAARDRIVLSNTNALEVPDLQDFSTENMVDSRLNGQMLGLPVAMLDRLRALDAFQSRQNWHLFRRPATLVRKETTELGRLVQKLSEKQGETALKVVTGEHWTGKSIYLVQAMTMALLNNWVVMNVPDGM